MKLELCPMSQHDSILAVVDVAFSKCPCGEKAESVCACGATICSKHSYSTDGSHVPEGLCADCVQVIIYETWMETMYGRSQA